MHGSTTTLHSNTKQLTPPPSAMKKPHHPIHDATEASPFGGLTLPEFHNKHNVIHTKAFMTNKLNKKIFTQTWRPNSSARLRGLVAMVHGYSSESSWVFQTTAVAIAKLGFFVCALDLPGHGYSEGRSGRIPDIEPVVDDCVHFFDSVRSGREKLPAFLYGESLGGAIAMLVSLRQKGEWSGLVLNGAMCGVSKRYMPPWPLEKLLPLAAAALPNWRVAVTKPFEQQSYREKWKRKLVMNSPNRRRYGKAPAATALEFLRVVKVVWKRCKELDLPLLVVHGEDDVVCDVESAEMVYNAAVSKEKSLTVFAGMGHQLIGESSEDVELAFGVIFKWLVERTEKSYGLPVSDALDDDVCLECIV